MKCLCICQVSRFSRQWKAGVLITKECIDPRFPNSRVFVDEDGDIWYLDSSLISIAPIDSNVQKDVIPYGLTRI